ncbi:MAG: ferritin family protein [Thermodesulfovibrionales bacterium]|nr:ferritin family protein [Thermodesulfovibrionales bacterium]
MNNKFTIKEVLEQAIQTEKLGYQFYTEMASRFKDKEKIKDLFTTLANKELAHEKTFTELLNMIDQNIEEGWEEASLYMRAIVESEFFLGKNKSLPSMDGIKEMSDAVNYAIGFEKETLLYFYGIRDVVREKEVVDEIINEEKSHIRWLVSFKNNN